MYLGLSGSMSFRSRTEGSGGLGATSNKTSSGGIGDGGPRCCLAIFLQKHIITRTENDALSWLRL
jgi:hypothetical protein